MLTSAVGRVAARRVLVVRASPQLQRPLASPTPALLARPGLVVFAATRAFSVSRCVRMPEAKKAKSTRSTSPRSKSTKKTSATTKTTTTKKKTPKKAAAKKTLKKPKAGSRKKELSPEDKDAAEHRLLKKVALLKYPTELPRNSYTVYLAQQFTKGGEPFTEQIKTISSNFKYLSELELEKLRATATNNVEKNKETHDLWVKSHPPEAIYVANIARARLSRKYKESPRKIQDDRLPARRLSPFHHFMRDRLSGRTRDSRTSVNNALSEVVAEWKAMPESEKSTLVKRYTLETGDNTARLTELKKKGKQYWVAQGVTGLTI